LKYQGVIPKSYELETSEKEKLCWNTNALSLNFTSWKRQKKKNRIKNRGKHLTSGRQAPNIDEYQRKQLKVTLCVIFTLNKILS
jgi:hypothetical protein